MQPFGAVLCWGGSHHSPQPHMFLEEHPQGITTPKASSPLPAHASSSVPPSHLLLPPGVTWAGWGPWGALAGHKNVHPKRPPPKAFDVFCGGFAPAPAFPNPFGASCRGLSGDSAHPQPGTHGDTPSASLPTPPGGDFGAAPPPLGLQAPQGWVCGCWEGQGRDHPQQPVLRVRLLASSTPFFFPLLSPPLFEQLFPNKLLMMIQ